MFSGPDKVQLLNQVICQHFYRQGMLDIADELAQVVPFLVPSIVGHRLNKYYSRRILPSLVQIFINKVPKILFVIIPLLSDQAGCCSSNNLDLYSGGIQFKSWPSYLFKN